MQLFSLPDCFVCLVAGVGWGGGGGGQAVQGSLSPLPPLTSQNIYFVCSIFLLFGGGGINRPGQLTPGGEDNQGRGKISWDIFTPGGGGGGKLSREGGKINCTTGLAKKMQVSNLKALVFIVLRRKWSQHKIGLIKSRCLGLNEFKVTRDRFKSFLDYINEFHGINCAVSPLYANIFKSLCLSLRRVVPIDQFESLDDTDD